MEDPGICKHWNCDRAGYGKHGYCRVHYQRNRNGVDMDKPIRKVKLRETELVCVQDGCPNPVWAKSMCSTHYSRVRTGVSLDFPIKPRQKWESCSVPECENDNTNYEFCSKHEHIHRTYNLSPLEIYELFTDAKCQSCSSTELLSVDHDHSCCAGSKSCGKCVRGVLCRRCNSALGLLDDDIEKVSMLGSYLRSRLRRTV